MPLTHNFAVLSISIPGPSQNCTSSVTCTVAMMLVFALEVAFSKHLQVLFCAIIGTGKNKFFETISPKFMSEKMFYAIIAIKYAFLIH